MWLHWLDMVTKILVPAGVGDHERPPSRFLHHPAEPSLWGVYDAAGVPPAVLPDEHGEDRRRGARGRRRLRVKWGGDGGEAATPEQENACGRKDGWRRRDMGYDPFQRGGRDPPLRGSERGPRPGEAYFRPVCQPPATPGVGWSGNLMVLPFSGGVQFELRPQVGPLLLRGGGHWPEAGVHGADSGKALTGWG